VAYLKEAHGAGHEKNKEYTTVYTLCVRDQRSVDITGVAADTPKRLSCIFAKIHHYRGAFSEEGIRPGADNLWKHLENVRCACSCVRISRKALKN